LHPKEFAINSPLLSAVSFVHRSLQIPLSLIACKIIRRKEGERRREKRGEGRGEREGGRETRRRNRKRARDGVPCEKVLHFLE
jgi:hypothetical protein